MIEPSRGRTTTSGPGAPLLIGLAATAALIVAFLIGFQLGSGEPRVRTVIVGASEPADAGRQPVETSSGAAPAGRIRMPQVADELQQAYYANLRGGSWVICSDAASLTCQPAAFEDVDGSRGFAPPASYWNGLPVATVPHGTRLYLVGNVEHVWVGAVHSDAQGWDRLLGVTLNGSVQYLDLGELPAGDYIVMDRSQNSFTQQGAVTRAAALTVQSSP
jgi:hypothetical protein